MTITDLLSPDEELVEEGIKYLYDYKLNDSLEYFIRAIEENPYSFRAHLYRGHSLLLKNLPIDALIEYRKAGKIKSGSNIALFYQAYAYYKSKKYDKAYLVLSSIIPELLNENNILEKIVLRGTKIRDSYNEIKNICGEKVRKDIRYKDKYLKKIQEYIEFKWYDKAMHTLNGLNNIYPETDTVHYFKGFIMFKKRRDTEAEQEFLKTVDINPNMKEAIRSLGVLYARRGWYNKSIELFKKILNDNPEDRLTKLYLDEILERQI